MRPATLIAALALVVALPGVAAAAPSACPEHHPGGLAPDILRPALTERARELCFRGYAVMHSGVSRTALAAAEHLTRERVQAARGLERENVFHAEERLPPEERAHLADYARSGLDRGHMAPSGDMPTPEAQAESFSLANMVPQDPGSNRCLWEGIESAVRDLAMREGEVFVLRRRTASTECRSGATLISPGTAQGYDGRASCVPCWMQWLPRWRARARPCRSGSRHPSRRAR